jgi:arylformamidase
VFDLEPLLATPINDRLRLDPPTARALSPLHRVRGPLPPALFAVGGAETPAFLGQNEAMHRAWLAAGQPGASLVIEGADHFTLLRELQRPGALLSGVTELFGPPW